MAKGGNTGKPEVNYLSDLEYFESHAFADWRGSASDLLTNRDKVSEKCGDRTVDSYSQTISNYEKDKADKGKDETKSLRGRVTEVETVLNGKMDKTTYQREGEIGKTTVTLQDCINDAKGQIEKLDQDLFPKSVSGKWGSFSPALASGSLTGLSVGVTAMSFGVTGIEFSFCGLCVMGAGLATGTTGADCTTHTADTNWQAVKYFISGGHCDTGVSEVEAETAEFDVGLVTTSVGAALTHIGPYLKL